MGKGVLLCGVALATWFAAVPAQAQETIVGYPVALDGGTLLFNQDGRETRVRLWGITAPAMSEWPWGPQARAALDDLITQGGQDARSGVPPRQVRCQPIGRDGGTTIAECALGAGEPFGVALVRQGVAVTDRQTLARETGRGEDYIRAEKDARATRAGIWK